MVNMVFNGTLLICEATPHHLTSQIRLQIELENVWDRRVSVLVMNGKMRLIKEGRILGFATLNPLITSAQIAAGDRHKFSMALDLTFRQIEMIEETRKGGDVLFQLNLGILYLEREKPTDRLIRSEIVRVTMPRTGTELKIFQSEWLKMLEEIGYERLRVIELPIPETPKGTFIDSSIQFVEEALKNYNEGDYDAVLSDCRRAIEVVEKADIDYVKVLDSSSKAEKIEGIQKRLKDFLSLGPHAESRDYINRRDAEVALYFTTSIIRYLAKQLLKTGKSL